MITINKFFRFFIIEHSFRMIFLITFVLLAILPEEKKYLTRVAADYRKVKTESDLVKELPAMQEVINQRIAQEIQAVVPASTPDDIKKNLVLRGTMVHGDKALALINDKVCKKGDVINGYTILEVSNQRVQIEDNITKIKNTLTISYRY